MLQKLKKMERKYSTNTSILGFVFREHLGEIDRHSHRLRKGNLVITEDGIGQYEGLDKSTYEVDVYLLNKNFIKRYHQTEVYQYFVMIPKQNYYEMIPLSYSDYSLLPTGKNSYASFAIEYKLTKHGFAKLTESFIKNKLKK